MPGMIDLLIAGLRRNATQVRGVKVVGAMADLVPLQQIAELTRLLNAPYLNSFGATETGLAPASGSLLAPGVVPTSLAKRESGFCRLRLVDADDQDVPIGTPGEAALRGPALPRTTCRLQDPQGVPLRRRGHVPAQQHGEDSAA